MDTDPRFSLANERTFLAWVRTALGFLAAGTGLVALDPPWPDEAVRGVAVVLTATAAWCALAARRRWRSVEDAIAQSRPAPASRGLGGLAVVIGAVAVALVALIVVG